MIDWIRKIIESHPESAPFAIAISLMMAGLNIPISADVVILIAATLAVSVLKGSFISLFLGIFIGSTCAAYIAYAQGRFLGDTLLKRAIFRKLFPNKRLEKIKLHYEKHSIATLFIGRFIPFGIRNALFISAGLSKFSFKKLAIIDFFACLVWSLTVFSSFYYLLQSVEDILPLIKKFNLLIFSILGLSIIIFIWYKQVKRRQLTT